MYFKCVFNIFKVPIGKLLFFTFYIWHNLGSSHNSEPSVRAWLVAIQGGIRMVTRFMPSMTTQKQTGKLVWFAYGLGQDGVNRWLVGCVMGCFVWLQVEPIILAVSAQPGSQGKTKVCIACWPGWRESASVHTKKHVGSGLSNQANLHHRPCGAGPYPSSWDAGNQSPPHGLISQANTIITK